MEPAISAYLRKVKVGETVLIFERERPIARLERITGDVDLDDRLGRLERAGLIRRGRERLTPEGLRGAAPKPRRSVVDALLEQRREGR